MNLEKNVPNCILTISQANTWWNKSPFTFESVAASNSGSRVRRRVTKRKSSEWEFRNARDPEKVERVGASVREQPGLSA